MRYIGEMWDLLSPLALLGAAAVSGLALALLAVRARRGRGMAPLADPRSPARNQRRLAVVCVGLFSVSTGILVADLLRSAWGGGASYLSGYSAHAQVATLETGTPAPDFALPEVASRRTVQLSNYRDRRPVVLVFGSFG